MTPLEIAIFMEEHKGDYYLFGFAAALLESRKRIRSLAPAFPSLTPILRSAHHRSPIQHL